MKRRILSTILSLALVFNLAGATAFAQEGTPPPSPPESSSRATGRTNYNGAERGGTDEQRFQKAE